MVVLLMCRENSFYHSNQILFYIIKHSITLYINVLHQCSFEIEKQVINNTFRSTANWSGRSLKYYPHESSEAAHVLEMETWYDQVLYKVTGWIVAVRSDHANHNLI